MHQYNQVKLRLKITPDMGGVNVYLHNKRQMVLPNEMGTYGTYKGSVEFPPAGWNASAGKVLMHDLHLKKTTWISVDHGRSRCERRESKAETFACISRFIESEVRKTVALIVVLRLRV